MSCLPFPHLLFTDMSTMNTRDSIATTSGESANTSTTGSDRSVGEVVVNESASVRPHSGYVMVVTQGPYHYRQGFVLNRSSSTVGNDIRLWNYSVKLFPVYDKHGVVVLKPEERIVAKHYDLLHTNQ